MSKFSLDGSMIPRSVRRMLDERMEPREPAESQTAVLRLRGRRHVVRLLNVSPSGAMMAFALVPNIGEELSLDMLGRSGVGARVLWVRDGKIGVNFDRPLE